MSIGILLISVISGVIGAVIAVLNQQPFEMVIAGFIICGMCAAFVTIALIHVGARRKWKGKETQETHFTEEVERMNVARAQRVPRHMKRAGRS